jgi:asparaginyl-tRNA synthetase
MEWITLDRVADHDGNEVEIRGWVSNRRSSGKVRFLLVRDGTGEIQSVVPKHLSCAARSRRNRL